MTSFATARADRASTLRSRRIARFLMTVLALAPVAGANAQSGDALFGSGFENLVAANAPKIAAPDIERALADDAVWNSLRTRCERDLNVVIRDIYAGFDWRQAAQDYGLCYAVGTARGDARAPVYGKKAVAVLKTLARSFPLIAPNQNHQFLAFGDGATRVFTLPMTPLDAAAVRVFTNPVTINTFTYSGPNQIGVTREFTSGALYPVLRVATTLAGATSNAAPEYSPEVDYHVAFRELINGDSQFNILRWLGAHHPASTYYVATNTNANDTSVTAGAFTVSGTTLTFNTAPATNTAIYVEYLGSDYTQTSNRTGRAESVKPDGPGYNMRAMNVGLAYGYDAIRQSPDLTSALRQEFYKVLNDQIDWYTQAGYEGPNLGLNPIGNYYIRGYLTGVMFTAYATDADNPRAMSGGDLKPLAHQLLHQTFDVMDADLPGGFGPQGTYSEGTNQDMLQLYDLWKRLTTLDGTPEDLAPQLAWTDHLVPATFHGTKPDRVTFYDGGDWNELPATPLTLSMRAFARYQPDHPMTPYARQLLADVGDPIAGTRLDYKSGATQFPLSYVAARTGPLYARSDWGTSAVWLSLAAGPVLEDHQHLDQGHFTLQRGADYLVINAGGYGILDSLPTHNTLGFDDRGAGNHIVYPPGQGYWGPDAKITRSLDHGDFVYAEADIADAYVNNDGVTNSVQTALRTLVYIRPNLIVMHDAMKVANANVKRIFNINFNAPTLARSGDVFAATRGTSKVFMRALTPANPTPTITALDYNGGTDNVSNYQVQTVGQTTGTFLHAFELAPSTQGAMTATQKITSSDNRAQGAQIDAGARRWVVLATLTSTPIGTATPLEYTLTQACPCTHVLTNLTPSTNFQITRVGGAGGTVTVASDARGVLTFETNDVGTTGIRVN